MVELLQKVVEEVHWGQNLEVAAEPASTAARTSSSPQAEGEVADRSHSDHNLVAGNLHIHSPVVEGVELAAAMARHCRLEEHSCHNCRRAAAVVAAMVGASRPDRNLRDLHDRVARVQLHHLDHRVLVGPMGSWVQLHSQPDRSHLVHSRGIPLDRRW